MTAALEVFGLRVFVLGPTKEHSHEGAAFVLEPQIAPVEHTIYLWQEPGDKYYQSLEPIDPNDLPVLPAAGGYSIFPDLKSAAKQDRWERYDTHGSHWDAVDWREGTEEPAWDVDDNMEVNIADPNPM